MDFIMRSPKSQDKNALFVVVNHLTKFAHLLFSAGIVAQAFLDRVFNLHGRLETISSDHDPIFISSF